MEPKKNPKVDLEKKRGLFMQIGLALSLLIVLGAFEYRSYEKVITSLGDLVLDADFEEEIENTFREEKPPTPHPTPPQ
jgi:protein TonB